MFLEALALKPSGRAVLLDDETEQRIVNNVHPYPCYIFPTFRQVDLKFYEGTGGLQTSPDKIYQNGTLVLSSHRILWIDAVSAPDPGRSCWLPLAAVQRPEMTKSVATKLNLKKDKIKLQVYSTPYHMPATDGVEGRKTVQVGLVFRDGIPQNLFDQLNKTLTERKWIVRPKQSDSVIQHTDRPWDVIPEDIDGNQFRQMTEMGFDRDLSIHALKATTNFEEAVGWVMAAQHDPSILQSIEDSRPSAERHVIKSGLGDIFKREEEKQRKRNQDLDEAFRDLESLMSKAEEMVKLADQFYASFSKDGRIDEETSATDQDTIEELINMGITNPVTKASAGSLYLDQMCRQLADFLEEPLRHRGGMMTLPDVYCLYNRARGAAELVSPDDLIQAARLFASLKMPLRLRTFDSGVLVIQSAAHDEAAVLQQIEAMVPVENGLSRPLTALDVSQELKVPLSIAQEHLLMGEAKALLCRDDAPGGLRFYYNFFKNL